MTADLLTERIGQLSPEKREAVEKLLRSKRDAERKSFTITRRDPSLARVAPLSFAQQRIWFLEQLTPGTPMYNIDINARISIPYDVGALRAALNEIVRRHEVLRTTFRLEGNEPVQVIAPRLNVVLPVIDLRQLETAEREAEAFRLASEEARQPFDLARGPLLRVKLLQFGPSEFIFLVTMHHIITDWVSMQVFSEELNALYGAFVQGQRSPLPEPNVQYADFAVWQRNWLQGEVLQAQLAYWKKRLANLSVVELIGDRPRPATPDQDGALLLIPMPNSLRLGLQNLSLRIGTTPYMTLLAAFQTLLHRYTGEDDIVVGATTANRNRAETERMLGFFVNSSILRTDLSGNPTFWELVQRVRKGVLETFENQDLPYEKLVEELHPERDLTRNPLYQVAFQLLPLAISAPLVARLRVDRGTALIDLNVDVIETQQGFMLRLEYSTAIFDESTILRLAKHYQSLLEAVVANSERHLSDLPLLSENERRQILTEWNAPVSKSTASKTLPDLFEAQVQHNPDGIALMLNDETVTYKELNRRANQLAHCLIQRKVDTECRVGIALERSVDLVVATLAVLKAGAAFVPLDPAYPRDRIQFIIEDGAISLLIGRTAHQDSFSDQETPFLAVDGAVTEIRNCRGENPVRHLKGNHLAYIIYTSGSTGRPKGVAVEERALVNHMEWMQSRFPVYSDDCALFKYPFVFDAALAELFGTLLGGGRLVIVEEGRQMDCAYLARLMARQSVTLLDTVPSLMDLLLEEPEFRGLRSLRRIILGGETMPPCLLQRLRNLDGVEIVNMYGPTECSITASFWIDDRQPLPGSVPIGRPISNARIYILDRWGQLSPPGMPGEIAISGVCLARGYHDRPVLTADRFTHDPFDGNSGVRLYKTGDRGRWLENGILEYLGRIDEQVKTRGYRIEPGEIEAVLNEHGGVATSVVMPCQKGQNSLELTAFVVPRANPPEIWPSVGEYFVYDELLYHVMTTDEVRTRAYRSAINRTVRGKKVIDLGTGADLALARICLEAGATKVYAVEMLDHAYERACRLAKDLDHNGRLTVIHGDSRFVELPEKVDVCVSELIGTIGSSEGVIEILNNARRFLRPGGKMIPHRCITKVAAVSLPEFLVAQPTFSEVSRYYAQKIFEAAGRVFDVRVCIKNLPPGSIVSDAAVFEDIQFQHPEPLESTTDFTLRIVRNCRVDGLVLWINLYPDSEELIDVQGSECSWLPVFLPVFPSGVVLQVGDTIAASASRLLEPGSFTPDYRICGSVSQHGNAELPFRYESRCNVTAFRSNAFYGALHDSFHSSGSQVAPSLAREGVRILNRYANAPEGNPNHQFLSQGLRQHLQQRLPDYMIPARFVLLERLPCLPSGKVDRRALAALSSGARPGPVGLSPRNQIEQAIALVWQELLGIDRVGVEENFFDLGGNSLLLVRLQRQLRDKLQIDLSLTQLFQSPTVSTIAGAAEVQSGTRSRRAADSGMRMLASE